MPAPTLDDITNALKAVDSGTGGLDIVARGWVKDVLCKDGHVTVTLEVPATMGPKLEPVRQAAEKIIHDLPGVISATVVLTAARAAQPATAKGGSPIGAGRIELPNVKHIVAVA